MSDVEIKVENIVASATLGKSLELPKIAPALENVEYKEVRGLEGIKEATVELGGREYNIAVINGAANFFKFMNEGIINSKQYQ